jgi:hypothetical protein
MHRETKQRGWRTVDGDFKEENPKEPCSDCTKVLVRGPPGVPRLCPFCETSPGRTVCDKCINTAAPGFAYCSAHMCGGCGRNADDEGCSQECPYRKCKQCKDPISVEQGLCDKCKCKKCSAVKPKSLVSDVCSACALCPHCKRLPVVDGKTSCELCRCPGGPSTWWGPCTGDAKKPCRLCKCKTVGCTHDKVSRTVSYCTECLSKPCGVQECKHNALQPTLVCSVHAGWSKCDEKECRTFLSPTNTLKRCENHLCKKCKRSVIQTADGLCKSCECVGGSCEEKTCTKHCTVSGCDCLIAIRKDIPSPCIKCACWICLGLIRPELKSERRERWTCFKTAFDSPVVSTLVGITRVFQAKFNEGELCERFSRIGREWYYTCQTCTESHFEFITTEQLSVIALEQTPFVGNWMEQ